MPIKKLPQIANATGDSLIIFFIKFPFYATLLCA